MRRGIGGYTWQGRRGACSRPCLLVHPTLGPHRLAQDNPDFLLQPGYRTCTWCLERMGIHSNRTLPPLLPPPPPFIALCSYMWSGWRPWARAFRDLQAENARAAPQEAAGGAGDAAEQQQQQKQQQQQQQQQQRPLSQPTTVPDLDPSTGDDAFGTVMAWLYSRIPATR